MRLASVRATLGAGEAALVAVLGWGPGLRPLRNRLAHWRGVGHKGRMFMRYYTRILVGALALTVALGAALAAENPYLGGWALTLPGGAPGWLGVEENNGQLKASMLWGWGSVEPTASASIQAGKLVVTRIHNLQRREGGKQVKKTLLETITATADGDTIQLSSAKPRENGLGEDKSDFSGKRIPPVPPAPDLAQVKFGEPLQLFNGQDLAGWRLTDPNAVNGWSVKDGLLVNDPVQPQGQPPKNYGNLRTDKEFEDFNITLEVRVPEGGNSGVYLRGIYEIQVDDSYGRRLDAHNMGALYSRIKPILSAEKPAGQWQTMDITLVDRHLTVVLNGKRIIDNQPVLGCTGGALWSDVNRPGPIYLQGDHTGIEYRNLVLRPVVK